MPDLEQQLAVLKEVSYVDKVYAGLAELRRRQSEPLSDPVDLRLAELRIFSQNGEDGVLFELVRQFARSSEYFVEFGVGDGWSCNTRILAEALGWAGTYFEIDPQTHAQLAQRYVNSDRVTTSQAAITPANISEQFAGAGVPTEFAVLCIDIDGQDYWVWEALDERFTPDIIIVEVNTSYGVTASATERLGVPQDELTRTFGASIRAMESLGRSKGYTLVHIEMAGVNAFFVRTELLAGREVRGIIDRSPNFGLRGRFHSDDRLYGAGPRVDRPTTEVG